MRRNMLCQAPQGTLLNLAMQMPSFLFVTMAVITLASSHSPSAHHASLTNFATMVGVPEAVGGPVGNMFDNPTCGTAHGGTRQYTANSVTYLYDHGPIDNVSNILPIPQTLGLGPDANPQSYSHCGKWLNAVWGDATNDSIVYAFYHQEWNCDYARDSFTNKSVGYAMSVDGGKSFSPYPDANNQMIAGANFTTTHQTGEGDHGVVRVGNWLYLFFTEWGGWRGATTVGVARSSVTPEENGRPVGSPGTWWKWHNGSFSSPGIGGPSDLFHLPGTTVALIEQLNVVVSVGLCWGGSVCVSAYNLSSTSGVQNFPSDTDWYVAPGGPLFTSGPGSWDRNTNATELYAYLSMIGPHGNDRPLPSNASFVYFTYLLPGQGFGARYLVRRPVRYLVSSSLSPPPSLAALSVWRSEDAAVEWWTSGPVIQSVEYPWSATPFTLAAPSVALVLTARPASSNASDWVELVDCVVTTNYTTSSAIKQNVTLSVASECSGTGRYSMRPVGWIATHAMAIQELAWVDGGVVDPATHETLSLRAVALYSSGAERATMQTKHEATTRVNGASLLLGHALAY
ncbi:membrane-associated protein, putative [Bodo saltans]|uniref:Membrane-associated protein, putative n=1 Tax=Bodo saltans TaxID=75058 RepID=A0A0S4J1Q8_BODSA|nr:membrane-associated protein, putative [Bodo saltans]|eukprot:CUG48167.1 membrane-associated protein, putative [Bodo saltans]